MEDKQKGALSLTRRIGETVSIGDDITVQITATRPGECQLRIVAPKDVRVMRTEIDDDRQEAV